MLCFCDELLCEISSQYVCLTIDVDCCVCLIVLFMLLSLQLSCESVFSEFVGGVGH